MSRARFWWAIAAMWWVFLAIGTLVPLLPHYVTSVLGRGDTSVGLTMLVYGVAAVVARPLTAGYLRDHHPWRLMSLCAVVGAIALALTPVIRSLAAMWTLRFVEGLAVGAFYTATAAGVVRETAPHRRGSALSYLSVPLFLGTAIGPVLGDHLISALGTRASWPAAGAVMALAAPCALVAARLGTSTSITIVDLPQLTSRELLHSVAHPAALLPAAILVLTIAGWAGFQAYVPLYGPTIGKPETGTVFFAYSAVVVLIRVVGASHFDRLPLVELVAVGCAANVAGLAVVWLWRSPPALYVAAVFMAVAVALCYGTLLRIALVGVVAHEEPAVVAAYSVAYDVGSGAGAAVLGVLAASSAGYPAVFLGGLVLALLASALVARLWSRRHWLAASVRGPASVAPAVGGPALGAGQ